MAFYFEYKIQNPKADVIHNNVALHPQFPLLAVASYGEEKGGFVTLFNDEGDTLEDVTPPAFNSAQATALAWHPCRKVLAVGWENGALKIWLEDQTEFTSVHAPHTASIPYLQWSSRGNRLVSADTSGTVVAWKADSRGSLQILYQVELKDTPCCIVYKSAIDALDIDISGLAKAAVAGDEQALDLFSSWRPKTASNKISLNQGLLTEGLGFYVGTLLGVVYYFNEQGSVKEIANESSAIKRLLYHASWSHLLVLTENLNVVQYLVETDDQLTEKARLKLTGRLEDAAMVWAGPSLLAVSTGELSIRCLNLESGENFLLTMEKIITSPSAREFFICLDFNPTRNILCGGTNLGSVALWKYMPSSDTDAEDNWHLQVHNKLTGSAIQHIQWGMVGSLFVLHTVCEIYFMREQHICASYSTDISAVQVAPNQLSVDLLNSEGHMELCCDMQIKGVFVSSEFIVIWGSKRLVVYEIHQQSKHLKVIGSFACECSGAVIYGQSIYCIDRNNIYVRTIQGTIKQTFACLGEEGEPIGLELCNHFLTVTTLLGYIKILDLSRREAKLHVKPKNMNDVIRDFGEVILARSNSTGNKVSITVARSNLLPDPRLYLWDIETDEVTHFNFSTGDLEQKTSIVTTSMDLSGRFAINHFWDVEEPKLLVCEAKLLPQPKDKMKQRLRYSTNTKPPPENKPDVVLVTMFASSDSSKLIVKDSRVLPKVYARLLGVHAPNFLLLRMPTGLEKGINASLVDKLLMSDFEGLESCDKLTKDAIINFSYHLTVGNMDEAFKAIKMIKSETVWENMAKMCVKTNRLDVAMVCFGHMGHARGTWGVKEAMRKEPELEAQVAMLAIQLDLNEEAESLYQQCKRYDLLNKFYQDTGQWDKAIQIAEQADRIHLRTTYYNYAKHLEFLGDLNAAVNMYEKSDTHRFEVPRMLVDEPNLLENYMKSNTDSNMLKWWAQYLESTGDMEGALKYYEIAGDTLALVRVHCYCENYDLASKVASETGDKAACYHLARQLENSDNIMLSIQFFTKAQAYGNAIRLCKEQGADEQVWSLALMASPQEQREAAVYFENIDRTDRAVRLYQRAGMLHKALDLAFKTQQYNALQSIATELDADSDPALVLRCARFFMENKLYDKAVDLLVVAKQFSAAVDLCLEHNVIVTEELAERMTVNKRGADDVENIRILVKMAECAQSQSNYHLAAKKFTQAGDKVRAMKALLKSGDTEKIVFFTNVSRQKDIYVMAANYLQSLDWRNSPDVMKNIIAFYSKGRALDLLAAFYVSCSQVEIDEFRDYEKAASALVEASRCLARSMATYKDGDTALEEQQKTAEGLARRLSLIKRYIELCRLLDKETDTAITQCREFLQVPDLEEAVRRGDVFAMMVAHHLRHKNMKAAAQVLDEMRATGTNPSYYIDVALLRELGMPGVSREGALRQNSEEIKEEEEIPEEQPNLRSNYHSVNGKAFAI